MAADPLAGLNIHAQSRGCTPAPPLLGAATCPVSPSPDPRLSADVTSPPWAPRGTLGAGRRLFISRWKLSAKHCRRRRHCRRQAESLRRLLW